jgi:hypothetical protein
VVNGAGGAGQIADPGGSSGRDAKSCKIILAGRPGWLAVKNFNHLDAKVICI